MYISLYLRSIANYSRTLVERKDRMNLRNATEWITNITFSEQKPSTDTIAADMDNQPFRDNGKLLFRPGEDTVR